MQASSTKNIQRFRGLNTVADPMRGTAPGTKNHESWEWQSIADNVDCTDSEGIQLREGYTAFVTGSGVTGSYSTFDYSRLYIIESGTLKRVNHDGTTLTLQTALSGDAFWSEVNDVVYLSCGTSKLEIHADGRVSKWGVPTPAQPSVSAANGSLFAGVVQVALTYSDEYGREGGASNSVIAIVVENGGVTVSNIPQLTGYTVNLYCTEPGGAVFYRCAGLTSQTSFTVTHPPTGSELTTQFLDEVPADAKYVALFGASLYAAEYIPEIDQTVIWISEGLGYHLFNLNSNYFIIPGEVTQMYGAEVELAITTQNRAFVYSEDKLRQVAEYGAVPGQHAELGADGKIYFWTKRGLCRVSPFENLTESRVSVAPGFYAGGGIIERGGVKKYVAIIHSGGTAFNMR